MTKMVISRYSEDVSWIKDYSIDYVIFNKGSLLDDPNAISMSNIGNNQRDIFEFIVENYENLPDKIIFIQGYPFDHCVKERFDSLIQSNSFQALESFDLEFSPNNSCKLDSDNGYMEVNNSWYISSHNRTYGVSCRWNTFEEFMNEFFVDYTELDWLRFTPGSQYVVPKENILYYTKAFWEKLMNILDKNNMTEGHVIERALWYIFTNKYTERK